MNEPSTPEMLRATEQRMGALFKKCGIPYKKIILTRVTVIVHMHGAQHCERVASLLNGAGWDCVIRDDRPSLFYPGKKSPHRVLGKLRKEPK